MDAVLRMFNNNHPYEEILEQLRHHHQIDVSLSTLKRWLRGNNMRRRPLQHNRSRYSTVVSSVAKELQGSGSRIGYRRVFKSLCNKGILCRRDDVRKILKVLDVEGVRLRKRRRLHKRKYRSTGPNHAWHIDGHDKLKPYGFSIHGCIDGFSRKLLWLEVEISNKKPEIIANYYLRAVKQAGGIPYKLKADNGTEHAQIEPMHQHLTLLNRDDPESFSIIPSTSNQRIEGFWSKLERDRIGWWRAFLKDLSDMGLLSSDPALIEAARYCFMHLIREELRNIMDDHNGHIIPYGRNGCGPYGRPDSMYDLPHLYGDFADRLVRIDNLENEVADLEECAPINLQDYTDEFKQFALLAMEEDGISHIVPDDVENASLLYLYFLLKVKMLSRL